MRDKPNCYACCVPLHHSYRDLQIHAAENSTYYREAWYLRRLLVQLEEAGGLRDLHWQGHVGQDYHHHQGGGGHQRDEERAEPERVLEPPLEPASCPGRQTARQAENVLVF